MTSLSNNSTWKMYIFRLLKYIFPNLKLELSLAIAA